MDELQFIPRKRIVEALEYGYRLIPGHEYQANDFAILMMKPEAPEALTSREISDIRSQFLPSRLRLKNTVAGARSCAPIRAKEVSARRYARLEREWAA